MPGEREPAGDHGRSPNQGGAYPTSAYGPSRGARREWNENWDTDRMRHAASRNIENGEQKGKVGRAAERVGGILQAFKSIDQEIKAYNTFGRMVREVKQGRDAVNGVDILGKDGFDRVAKRLEIAVNGRTMIFLPESNSYIAKHPDGRAQIFMWDPDPKLRADGVKAQKELNRIYDRIDGSGWLTRGFMNWWYKDKIHNLAEVADQYDKRYGPIKAAFERDMARLFNPNAAVNRTENAFVTQVEAENNRFGAKNEGGFTKNLAGRFKDIAEGVGAHIPFMNRLTAEGTPLQKGRIRLPVGICLVTAGDVISVRGRSTTVPSYVRAAEKMGAQRRAPAQPATRPEQGATAQRRQDRQPSVRPEPARQPNERRARQRPPVRPGDTRQAPRPEPQRRAEPSTQAEIAARLQSTEQELARKLRLTQRIPLTPQEEESIAFRLRASLSTSGLDQQNSRRIYTEPVSIIFNDDQGRANASILIDAQNRVSIRILPGFSRIGSAQILDLISSVLVPGQVEALPRSFTNSAINTYRSPTNGTVPELRYIFQQTRGDENKNYFTRVAATSTPPARETQPSRRTQQQNQNRPIITGGVRAFPTSRPRR